jgi:DNA-binding transcriptional LysR family regulator
MDTSSNAFSLDVRRFRVLSVLKKCGTINATASALNLTPSAISQQITSLSKEIGAPLLVPNGRGVRLTPQAEIILGHAQAIDRHIELTRSDLAAFEGGEIGQVVISAFQSSIPVLVAPSVSRLQIDHPRFRISVQESSSANGFIHLDACDVDLVIAVDSSYNPLGSNTSYCRYELLEDPFLIAVPRDSPMASKEIVSIKDLSDQAWIMAPAIAPCRELTLAACVSAGFNPDIRHNVDNWNSVLSLVSYGLGIAFVPRSVVASGVSPGVALIKSIEGYCPSRHWFAVTRSGSENNVGLKQIVTTLQDTAKHLA